MTLSPCICNSFRIAARKISTFYDAELERFGINIAQYSLLRAIKAHQPISYTQLGQQSALERSTIGRNVGILEKKTLVSTRRGFEDQREILVSLTENGEKILHDIFPVWRKCQNDLMDRMGKDKMNVLNDIFSNL